MTWFFFDSVSETTNFWYVSDYGSDDNDCHSEYTPCNNLQTVLNRATDGADVYVTSNLLSLKMIWGYGLWIVHDYKSGFLSACIVNSMISYTLQSINSSQFEVTCPGKIQDVDFIILTESQTSF